MTQETAKDSSVSTTSRNKDANSDNQRQREKRGDKIAPMSKVVIRRLPPSMTLDTFLDQISPVPANDYMYFVKADMSLGSHAFSRAYINFLNQEDIFFFTQKFDDYVFVDQKGNEYSAVVEFAPFQKIPKKKAKKKDAKCGTIDQDPDYLKFLESLQSPDDTVIPTAESYLEEIEARERELKANNGIPKMTTPLIEYIKNKKAERQRIREEKREERKRRELERKRLREEERKKRKAEKEKGKDKVRDVSKEKDKDEKKTDAKSKSEPVLKLLKNPDREKEKELEKDKESSTSKEKNSSSSDKTLPNKEKTSRVTTDWEKERHRREEERFKQREMKQNERKDRFRKDRDDQRSIGSYKSEKRLDARSDGEKYDDKSKDKDGGDDPSKDKHGDKDKTDERDKFRRSDYKKPDRYRDDYHGRRDDWKYRPDRRWDNDHYRQDHRRGGPKAYERSREYGYRDKFSRDRPAKEYVSNKDGKNKRVEDKSRQDETDGTKTATTREKYYDEDKPSDKSKSVEANAENVEMRKDDLEEAKNDKETRNDDGGGDKEDSGGDGKTDDNGKDGKQDPRSERRIRNKDRPSLEIYRPGMRRLSLQRNSPQKEVTGSPSSSSSPSPTPQTLGKITSTCVKQVTKVETPEDDSPVINNNGADDIANN